MHVARIATAAAVVAALTVSLIAPATAQAAVATGFTVYDNTAYTSVDIGNGSVKSNTVPASVCDPLTAGGAMPAEATWQADVEAYDINPGGPLVLDCEDLYLTGTGSAAQAVYNDLSQLQAWARDVEPSQVIGWYGLLENTTTANYPYYQDLIASDTNTAFFPSGYTFSASEETWDTTIQADAAKAAAIDSSVPVIPYVWPQYHQGSSPSSLSETFIPAAQWAVELAQIAESGMAGVVIWGGLSTSGTCSATCESEAGSEPWYSATEDFLTWLASPQTDIAQGASATASSTNVAGRGPAQAVDGNPFTRWGSQYSDPQWIEVDLGASYDITGVRLMWETAYGTAYQIQTSPDGTDWTTIFSTTTGTGGVEYLNGLSGTGRYIRMYGSARGTSYGYSLWDFNVYGNPS